MLADDTDAKHPMPMQWVTEHAILTRRRLPAVGMSESQPIPVVDVFAGPGGLGEGFASCRIDGERSFDDVLSIECDPVAFRTLELRCWFRRFERSDVPEDYYRFLRREMDRQALFAAYPDAAEDAARRCWCAQLGRVRASSVYNRVREALGDVARPWVLVGGPPCQAYSSAGRARRKHDATFADDEKHTLYREYLKILANFRPAVFVLENVKGLLSARLNDRGMFDRIRKDLERPASAMKLRGAASDPGYDIYPVQLPDRLRQQETFVRDEWQPIDFLVRSEQFGIPQCRHRVFLLGVRRDLKIAPRLLETDTEEVGVERVLNTLPPLRAGLTDRPDGPAEWFECLRSATLSGGCLDGTIENHDLHRIIQEAVDEAGRNIDLLDPGSEFIEWDDAAPEYRSDWYADDRIGGVCHHSARRHLGDDLRRYLFAAAFGQLYGESPKLKHFPRALLPRHENARFRQDGRYDFADRFRVHPAGHPALTVVSHIAKDGHYYIHYDPSQCRSFTVREAARVQTFPDNYFFCGNRTDQYRQVGNAVPPLLAFRIAEQVRDVLERAGLAAGSGVT